MNFKKLRQHVNLNIFRYACVGGVCTIFDLSVFMLFAKYLGYNYILVSSTGFAIATFLNYMLCIRFIFESGARFTKYSEITSIFTVSLLGLLFNQFALFFSVEVLGVEMFLSKVFATGAVFLWNYFSRSAYVFSKS